MRPSCCRRSCKKSNRIRIHKLDIVISGTGAGRETAVRTLQNMGMDVGTIKDITPTLTMVADQRKEEEDNGKIYRT